MGVAEDVTNIPAIAVEIVLDWVRRHPVPDKDGSRLVPVCIWGERGVGKTQMVKGYCRTNNYGYRGYHPAHDNTGSDLVGLPMLNKELGRTEYATPYWLPAKAEGLLIEQQGLIFIDEINRAPLSVLQGLMELIGEARISHSGYQMPEGWGIIAAANPPREGYFVGDLDEALIDRMLHVPIGFDLARWIAWAEGNGINQEMMNFAAQNNDLIPGGEAILPDTIHIEPTPRSMEFLARLYEPGMNRRLLITIARGLIGVEATIRFIGQLDASSSGEATKVLTADDILEGAFQNPAYAPEADETTNEFLLAALIRRLPEEPSVSNVASYMLGLTPELAKTLWDRIALDAPAWKRPLAQVIAQRENNS